MALPTGSALAALIVADLGDHDPRSLAAWTKVCNQVIAAMKQAQVVPTALIAPPGTAGGPVTGTGTIT